MSDSLAKHFREQLLTRRRRLSAAAGAGLLAGPAGPAGPARVPSSASAGSAERDRLRSLIDEVDAALGRLDDGTFGLCQACGEPVETDRLLADPLCCFCLDHLTAAQREALEADVELAARIQASLLPPRDLQPAGWEFAYRYAAAGPAGGDCCDLIAAPDGALWALVGDVQGKGLAAALVMSHLHATFRALVSQRLPLAKTLEQASRALCESTLPSQFATLACLRATSAGEVEIGIAGHHAPLLVRGGEIRELSGEGLPLGLFCDARFVPGRARVQAGDLIVMYTDGLIEAENRAGLQYGEDRLRRQLLRGQGAGRVRSAEEVVADCSSDLQAHLQGLASGDDVTLMVLRRH